MECPGCRTAGSVVVKTMDDGQTITRRRLCACGGQWVTRERTKVGSFMVINDRGQGTLVANSGQGGLDLPSGSSLPLPGNPDQTRARSDGRAKKTPAPSPYSAPFEATWKLYGRKEEKVKAYAAWKLAAQSVDGEEILAGLVSKALAWQAPLWAADGWNYAKYFERYLKARKWEDEPRPAKPERRATSRSDGNVDEIGSWLARGTR